MTGDNHQDQQSAHCSLTTILMIRRLCARLLMTSHHYYCSIKKGDGTARRALLKAVSILSLERGPLVPTQILWKQFHVVTVFSTSQEKNHILLDAKPGRENRPERRHEWVPQQWPAHWWEIRLIVKFPKEWAIFNLQNLSLVTISFYNYIVYFKFHKFIALEEKKYLVLYLFKH